MIRSALASALTWRSRRQPHRGADRRAALRTRSIVGTSLSRSTSSTGERSGIDVVYSFHRPPALDGTASGRRGARCSRRGQHPAHVVGGIGLGEQGRHGDRVFPGGRLRLVKDAAASRVRDDQETGAGVDVRCTPVHFHDPAPRRCVSTQSPIWNGCSNNTSRPRDDLAD